MFIKRSAGGRSFTRSSSSSQSNNRFGSSYSGSQGGNRNGFRRNPRMKRGESIDISKFILKSSDRQVVEAPEIKNTFYTFGLSSIIEGNLKKRGFETPTPIQDQAIGNIIAGRDLVGLANTGTGKTAAFLLPMLQKVYHDKTQKVLIIAPTRELALQIEQEFRLFSWGMQIFSASCVGGMPIFKQIANLRRNPNFVIGTPGRLKDLSERKIIQFHTFNNIVIDEIDRMLDMGFIDDIKLITSQLPEKRQSLVFSATLPDKIRHLISQFLREPITIAVKTGDTALNVDQDVIRVQNHEAKFDQLKNILKNPESKKVLIFSETKREVEKLAVNLSSDGFRAESIHGDKKQNQRVRALAAFKGNSVNILVATDVAARGLDIKDITHVINYTLPQTYDDYCHRIGRTGRGMSKGKALTFVEAR